MVVYPARIAPLITADQRLVDLNGRARAALAQHAPEDSTRGGAFEMSALNAVHRSVAVHSLMLDGCKVTMKLAERFDSEQGSVTETGADSPDSP